MPIPLSHQHPVDSVTYLSVHNIQETVGDTVIHSADAGDIDHHILENEYTNQIPLLQKKCDQGTLIFLGFIRLELCFTFSVLI